MERIIEISLKAKLNVKNKQLVVKSETQVETIPLEDIAVILLVDSQIVVTNYLLASCSENNISVIVCNSRKLPVSIIMPFSCNSLNAKFITMQSELSMQLKNKIWKQVIKAKLASQTVVLEKRDKNSAPVKAIRSRVKTGDSDNCEARAAAIYWKELFGKQFVRDFNKPGINACLNYGYAIIRAVVARAIVGTGLHPTLGIHHHNQYDSYCLANDLMEPFRPLVDDVVFDMNHNKAIDKILTKENRHTLLNILNKRLLVADEYYPMFTALERYVSSIKQVMMKNQKQVFVPELVL